MNRVTPYPPTDSNGYIKAVYYGQNERVDELNTRLNDRTFPDAAMQPNFSPRPVQTKYTTFPMLNARSATIVPIDHQPEFTTDNFYTGTSNAPNFVNNVDKESELRNQFFALQKSDQAVYVPDKNSDLYKVDVVYRPSDQQYPDLFAKPQFDNIPRPNLSSIGNDLFNNNTRTQLRNSK